MAERKETNAEARNPVIRLILENPISAINTAAILFGGGFVYASNEKRMEAMEVRILGLELRQKEDLASFRARENASNQKVEAISNSLNDVRVTVRGIEASVQFLVQQVQRDRTRIDK